MPPKTPLLLLLSLVSFASAPACSSETAPEDPQADAAPGTPDAAIDSPYWQPDGTLDERRCPPASFLTFHNFASAFFTEYCTGCHSAQIPANMRQKAPAGVDFDTADKIRAHAARIYARAADGYASMPPQGGPSAAARELLGEWLACGMP